MSEEWDDTGVWIVIIGLLIFVFICIGVLFFLGYHLLAFICNCRFILFKHLA